MDPRPVGRPTRLTVSGGPKAEPRLLIAPEPRPEITTRLMQAHPARSQRRAWLTLAAYALLAILAFVGALLVAGVAKAVAA